MKRKRLSEGEIRFRVSKADRGRLEWLMRYHPDEPHTISALIRTLIAREEERLKSFDRNILKKG